MKKILLLCCLTGFSLLAAAQTTKKTKTVIDTIKASIVEASCGTCKFGMEGKGCALAVRVNGKAYWVDGTSLDNHGDAHEPEGMCNSIRKAEVSGEIKEDRYVARTFKLLPVEKEK